MGGGDTQLAWFLLYFVLFLSPTSTSSSSSSSPTSSLQPARSYGQVLCTARAPA